MASGAPPSLDQSQCGQGPSEVSSENEITIVLTGKTGAGKSSLARSIVGAQVNEAPTPKPVSQACEKYVIVRNGVSLKLVDTVGLMGSEKDMSITIHDIADYTKCHVDVLVYCLPVGPGAKFVDGNPMMMRCLQKAFKDHIWKHCLLVFTLSNVQLDSLKKAHKSDRAIAYYKQYIKDFAAEFQKELRKLGVKDVVVRTIFDGRVPGNNIPTIMAVPAGMMYTDEVLPGIRTENADKWMSVLLTEVEDSCTDERKEAFKRYRASKTWSEIVTTTLKVGGTALAIGAAAAAIYYAGIGPVVAIMTFVLRRGK